MLKLPEVSLGEEEWDAPEFKGKVAKIRTEKRSRTHSLTVYIEGSRELISTFSEVYTVGTVVID